MPVVIDHISKTFFFKKKSSFIRKSPYNFNLELNRIRKRAETEQKENRDLYLQIISLRTSERALKKLVLMNNLESRYFV